jgi:hypothetical protein
VAIWQLLGLAERVRHNQFYHGTQAHLALVCLSPVKTRFFFHEQPTRPSGEYRIISETVPRGGVLDPLYHSYFSNITGFVRGNVAFQNLSSKLFPAAEWNETEVALKIGRWDWSATNKVAMSLLSRPVNVDEKEKEEFKDVAMLHVSSQIFRITRLLVLITC